MTGEPVDGEGDCPGGVSAAVVALLASECVEEPIDDAGAAELREEALVEGRNALFGAGKPRGRGASLWPAALEPRVTALGSAGDNVEGTLTGEGAGRVGGENPMTALGWAAGVFEGAAVVC